MNKTDNLVSLAKKNEWQCFKDGEFTWFAGDNCPNNGSSDCPLTMRADCRCNMTEEDEKECLRAYGAFANERMA